MAASSRRVRSAGLFLFFAASFVAAVYSWAAPLGDWLGTGEKGSGSVRLSHLASDTEGGGHGSGKGVPLTESLGPNGKAWKSEEAKRGKRTFLLAVDNRSPLDLPISASNYLATCAAVNWYYANVVFPLIASKDAAIAQETFSYAYYIANVSCPDQGACGWTEEAGKGGTAVAGEGAVGAGGKEVHPAWIAIKAALQLLPTMAEGDIGILADTDVFVDVTKHTTFYHSVLPKLEGFLDGGRPVGLLRDGSFWRAKARDYGYKIDVQSGIIFFVKTKERTAEKFFRDMWKSASKPSPAELLLQDPFKFLKQWPWMQERLTWFSSDVARNQSFAFYPNIAGKWRVELPWCFGMMCHRNFEKVPYINDYIRGMLGKDTGCQAGPVAAIARDVCGMELLKDEKNASQQSLDELVAAILPLIDFRFI